MAVVPLRLWSVVKVNEVTIRLFPHWLLLWIRDEAYGCTPVFAIAVVAPHAAAVYGSRTCLPVQVNAAAARRGF